MNDELLKEEQVIKNIIQGKVDQFRILVERYQKHVFSVGMRFFKNEEDSYDFVQDVFIRAFDKLETYKGEGRFRYWLIKIAFNHGINMIKGLQNDSLLLEQALAGDERTPEAIHLQGEIREVLVAAVEKLPIRYQVCMDFYFFLGLTYDEICTITEMPVNTIKSNVLRSKQILRDALSGTIAEEYYEM